MFCPKCGTENPDANKFCRSCRESLLVVAQAMKKRLPVMIVSKLDAALERLSERFRRDSVLHLVLGIGMLILAAVDFGWRPTSSRVRFDLLIAAVGFLISGWSYLLYKRSLMHGEKLESGEFVTGSFLDSILRAMGIRKLDQTLTPELQILFCPACGVNAEKSVKHCRSCGANLHSVRLAIKPNRWRLLLNSLLDKYIGFQSDKFKIRENARQMLFFPFLFLAMGIRDIYRDQDPTYLLFSFMFFVMVFWDRAASHRWFSIEEKSSDLSQANLTDRVLTPTSNELALSSATATSPMSMTEETTRRLEPVLVQSQEEAETRKL